MKIIVMGGAGDMGSRAVEDLASSKGVARVTIADRNAAAAEKIKSSLAGKSAKVEVKAVDANDHTALVKAMKGHDVVASALGPFFMFEAKLVRAAIEAGVNYASICDEADAAEAVFRDFDVDARKKRVTVLTGLGASPGLSNVGVRFMSKEVGRIKKAEIYVYQPLDAGGGEAVIRHMLHIMTGKVVAWRGGRKVTVRACSRSKIVEFPKYGRVKLWNMGHSEPYTVPRYFYGIEEVGFYMGYGKGAEFLVWPARAGLFLNKRVTDATVRLLLRLEGMDKNKEPGWGAIRIDVWGEKKGKEEHRMLCGIGQMREATGLSLSIGAQLLGEKKLLTKEGGVYAPEGCLDPQDFIRRMKDRGQLAYADLAMTQPLA
ncbi:MAG: saccharopine dehydrogenase NADP-binding domain-containing protein [Nitrospirae bacterium]|nr:saccharopine dehydrogenase NADP-binding domain-containing protein [Nitrospirota bacterium]